MADVDGKWNCSVATPMGDQNFELTVTAVGDRFSGAAAGSFGAMTIPDGTIDGDTLQWSMKVSKPMPLTLTCKAAVTGDALAGQVRAGVFGSFPITGTRG